MIRLDSWSTTTSAHNPFLAPELRGICLQGIATDHPKLGTGPVTTSPIVSFSGRVVCTSNGSVYRLGRIDPGFRRWLRKNRPAWNWRKPITRRTS